MRGVVLSLVLAAAAAGQTPVWKEFLLAPAGKLDKPLERTSEWMFEPAGARVVYPVCCPWLDVEGRFGRIANDPWSLQASGVSLKSLLARMEGVPQVRIVAPEWMTRQRFDLIAVVCDEYRLQLRRREEAAANTREELRGLIGRELEERLQIRMHREKREVPVYILKTSNGRPPTLGQADDATTGLRVWAREGAFDSTNANDFILLTWLQNVVKRPVFGEGLPQGPYRCALKWRPGDVRALATALWEELGLVLIEGRREVELLVVDAALKPEWL
ncbi:MAG TPA: TIGR03435 family protein [Candidatus Acidoferrales bacterium]|nr:TIGR03435 family protein [Candidatus Acidoferrales bacterium]HXK02101.1 TIGR03435 family protein [Verrucomicrobiae bacterium]